MIDAVTVIVAVVALLVASVGMRAQARSGGRIPPERRAALRMAWADVRQIEQDHGLEPTPVPWYVRTLDVPADRVAMQDLRARMLIGTTSTGPR